MGLRSVIEAGIDAAFNAVGGDDGLLVAVTYKSVTGSTYDVDTGSISVASTNVNLTRALLYDFDQKEVDNDVAIKTDQKFCAPAKDFGGIVPKSLDTFVDDKGRNWEVIKLMGVPADLLYILHVRSTR